MDRAIKSRLSREHSEILGPVTVKVARSNNMRPLKFEVPPATERALQLRQRAGCQTSKLASQPTMATLQSDHTAREAGKEMKAEEETESSKHDSTRGQVGTPHPP